MKWLNKLERKFGKYSIYNLTLIIIACYIIGYILAITYPEFLYLIMLDPAKVMEGQIYRLFTWVLIPPSNPSIFVVIMLMFYYYIGTNLERTWGAFKYNLYIFSGILFTNIGIMGIYITMLLLGNAGSYHSTGFGASTYYLSMSMFLAFAALYPDMQILLYFIIPVKIKWLAYFDIAYLIFVFLVSGFMHDYTSMIMIVMSLLNFILFYFGTKNLYHMSPKSMKRRKKYKREVRHIQVQTKHKCTVCGQTEEDNPSLEFRYCSKCNGNYEYCQNHLFTHEHKK